MQRIILFNPSCGDFHVCNGWLLVSILFITWQNWIKKNWIIALLICLKANDEIMRLGKLAAMLIGARPFTQYFLFLPPYFLVPLSCFLPRNPGPFHMSLPGSSDPKYKIVLYGLIYFQRYVWDKNYFDCWNDIVSFLEGNDKEVTVIRPVFTCH